MFLSFEDCQDLFPGMEENEISMVEHTADNESIIDPPSERNEAPGQTADQSHMPIIQPLHTTGKT